MLLTIRTLLRLLAICVCGLAAVVGLGATPPKKPHTIALGSARQVPYSKAGDPAGADPDETILKIRALLVDSRVSEWTTGEAHDVTDRSFAVRRALRVNDSLPEDPSSKNPQAGAHWVWQRGPWLLIDRLTGHVIALKLPDYDPSASQVVWFRDYAAYCGVTPSGKSLFAVVSQIGQRKPILSKKLSSYDIADHPSPVCGLPEWQREPLRITFHPTGRDPASFDVVGGSAVLVEDGDDEPEVPAKP